MKYQIQNHYGQALYIPEGKTEPKWVIERRFHFRISGWSPTETFVLKRVYPADNLLPRSQRKFSTLMVENVLFATKKVGRQFKSASNAEKRLRKEDQNEETSC